MDHGAATQLALNKAERLRDHRTESRLLLQLALREEFQVLTKLCRGFSAEECEKHRQQAALLASASFQAASEANFINCTAADLRQ